MIGQMTLYAQYIHDNLYIGTIEVDSDNLKYNNIQFTIVYYKLQFMKHKV